MTPGSIAAFRKAVISQSFRMALPLMAMGSLAGLEACRARPQGEAAPYRIYVSNETSGTVSVIDGRTHKVAAVIMLGKRPRGIRASADGRQLFVALSGSPIAPPGVDERTLPPADRNADGIGILNTPSLKLARVLKGVVNPEQLALGADGKLYAAVEDVGALLTMDSVTGVVQSTIPVGAEPEGVALSRDGRFAYVTVEGDNSLAIVDLKASAVVKHLSIGKRPRGIAVSPDGLRIYVTGENDASLTAVDAVRQMVVQTATVPGQGAKPMGVAVSPDGKRVFVTTGRGGQLVAFNSATLAPQRSVVVGARPWGVAVSPDGRYVFTADGPSDDIAVVDAESLTVAQRVGSAGKPWGVIVAPRCCD